MPAQLVHADLKGNVCPGGGLLKDHGEVFTPQELMDFPLFFQGLELFCVSEDLTEFLFADIKNRQKILLHRNSFIWFMRCSSNARVPISRRWRTFPETADAACSAMFSASSRVGPSPTNARVREVRVDNLPSRDSTFA